MNAMSFCTISTLDYMPYVCALYDSLMRFNSDVVLNVFISDAACAGADRITSSHGIRLYGTDDLCMNGTGRKILEKYRAVSMDAFRWAMKPVFLQHLLERGHAEALIYVDNDIHFFNDYSFLFDELETHDIILTPHWRSSDPQADSTNFFTLYTSGLYNGGFVGVTRDALPALAWWASACLYVCEKNAARGQFVDQAHLNLLPVYFDRVKIIRHRGCNVANWNRLECRRVQRDGTVLINGVYSVVFIHFTHSTIRGIDRGDDAPLAPFLQEYRESLRRHGAHTGPGPVCAPVQSSPPAGMRAVPDENAYTRPELTGGNLDRYVHRTAIFAAIRENRNLFSGRLLDYGCGRMPYKNYILAYAGVTEYIGLDIAAALDYGGPGPDIVWNGETLPFAESSFDVVLATEVLEHIVNPDRALREVNRVLKDNGLLFFTVPYVWPLHEVPFDYFRYTPFALEKILTQSGYSDIVLRPTGGWNAALAQMLGLWARRKPMAKARRRIFSWVLTPVIRRLLAGDVRPGAFSKNTMMPGLYGVARK